LTLFELTRTNVETIYNILKEYLEERKLLNKVKFLCKDGAKTMSSYQEGAAGKLMKELKNLQYFKRLCHQESLALKHTYQEFPELGSLIKLP